MPVSTARPESEQQQGAVIALGASAGGVEALKHLCARLPADLPAAVLVVLHLSPSGESLLPDILTRAGDLAVHPVQDEVALRPGFVYVAVPNRHLIVADGAVRSSEGPRENGHRPSIDVTFRTLAHAYGPRAVGVVLTGTLDDGSLGLHAIQARGGRVLVQDPEQAAYPDMPRNASRAVRVDAALGLDELAERLTEIAREDADPDTPPRDPGPIAQTDPRSTRYTCPECGGVLWEHDGAAVAEFVCSVGHRYSPESLEDGQDREVERALWAGARMLGDRATLLRQMAADAEHKEHLRSAGRYRQRAEEAAERSKLLEELVHQLVHDTGGLVAD